MSWPPESWPWPRTLGLLAGIIAATLLVIAVVLVAGFASHLIGVPSKAHPGDIDPKSLPFIIVAQLLSYVPAYVGVPLILPIVARKPLREIGFRAPTLRDVGLGFLGAVVIFVVTTILTEIIKSFGVKSPEASVEIFKQISGVRDQTLFVSLAILFAPLYEELIFRVVLFNAIRRYSTTLLAALISGGIFGLIHMSIATPADVVPQLLAVAIPIGSVGVMLAYVYAITGCYWSNVITHATFNSVSVIAILFFHQT